MEDSGNFYDVINREYRKSNSSPEVERASISAAQQADVQSRSPLVNAPLSTTSGLDERAKELLRIKDEEIRELRRKIEELEQSKLALLEQTPLTNANTVAPHSNGSVQSDIALSLPLAQNDALTTEQISTNSDSDFKAHLSETLLNVNKCGDNNCQMNSTVSSASSDDGDIIFELQQARELAAANGRFNLKVESSPSDVTSEHTTSRSPALPPIGSFSGIVHAPSPPIRSSTITSTAVAPTVVTASTSSSNLIEVKVEKVELKQEKNADSGEKVTMVQINSALFDEPVTSPPPAHSQQQQQGQRVIQHRLLEQAFVVPNQQAQQSAIHVKSIVLPVSSSVQSQSQVQKPPRRDPVIKKAVVTQVRQATLSASPFSESEPENDKHSDDISLASMSDSDSGDDELYVGKVGKGKMTTTTASTATAATVAAGVISDVTRSKDNVSPRRMKGPVVPRNENGNARWLVTEENYRSTGNTTTGIPAATSNTNTVHVKRTKQPGLTAPPPRGRSPAAATTTTSKSSAKSVAETASYSQDRMIFYPINDPGIATSNIILNEKRAHKPKVIRDHSPANDYNRKRKVESDDSPQPVVTVKKSKSVTATSTSNSKETSSHRTTATGSTNSKPAAVTPNQSRPSMLFSNKSQSSSANNNSESSKAQAYAHLLAKNAQRTDSSSAMHSDTFVTLTEEQQNAITEKHIESKDFHTVYEEHHTTLKSKDASYFKKVDAALYFTRLAAVDYPPVAKFESSKLVRSLSNQVMISVNDGNKDLLTRCITCIYYLLNLAEGSDVRVKEIINAKLIWKLVEVIRNDECDEALCQALNVVNMLAYKEHVKVIEAGVVDAVLEIVHEDSEERVLFHASKLLANLCKSPSITTILSSRTVHSLLQIMLMAQKTGDTRITIFSCDMVKCICDCEKDRRKRGSELLETILTILSEREGILYQMSLHFVKSKTMNVQTAIASTYASVIDVMPTQQIPTFLRVYTPLPTLITMLQPLKQSSLCHDKTLEACKCLSLLTDYPSRIIHAVTQGDTKSSKFLKLLENYRDYALNEDLQGYAKKILGAVETSLRGFNAATATTK